VAGSAGDGEIGGAWASAGVGDAAESGDVVGPSPSPPVVAVSVAPDEHAATARAVANMAITS